MDILDAGDLIFLNFDPQAGHEQAGIRPALVLSPASYTKITKLAIVCPITNQKKGYPFEVELPKGLKITGVVLVDHIKCLDVSARNAKKVDTAPKSILQEVRDLLKEIIL